MFNAILIVLIIVLVIYGLKRAGVGGIRAEENMANGSEYLKTNLERPEVTETETGLQYEVLAQGEGTEKPTATSQVTVHYHGTLINGSVFDSSVDRGEPIAFGLNQVIPGWTEGVQLMSVGDKYRFYIPADLGYGNRRVGSIPGGSVLIFDVELLAIG